MMTSRPASDYLRLRRSLASAAAADETATDDNADQDKDAYERVYNLVSNNERRWPEDNLRRCLMAGILFEILRSSQWIPQGLSVDEEIFLAKLVLRNLQVRFFFL